jgi:hypothetical protein
MEKLRAEIANFNDVELTRNELRNMTYLQNVLKESKSPNANRLAWSKTDL